MNIRNNIETTRVVNSKINLSILKLGKTYSILNNLEIKIHKVIGERPLFVAGRTNGPTNITPFILMLVYK